MIEIKIHIRLAGGTLHTRCKLTAGILISSGGCVTSTGCCVVLGCHRLSKSARQRCRQLFVCYKCDHMDREWWCLAPIDHRFPKIPEALLAIDGRVCLSSWDHKFL